MTRLVQPKSTLLEVRPVPGISMDALHRRLASELSDLGFGREIREPLCVFAEDDRVIVGFDTGIVVPKTRARLEEILGRALEGYGKARVLQKPRREPDRARLVLGICGDDDLDGVALARGDFVHWAEGWLTASPVEISVASSTTQTTASLQVLFEKLFPAFLGVRFEVAASTAGYRLGARLEPVLWHDILLFVRGSSQWSSAWEEYGDKLIELANTTPFAYRYAYLSTSDVKTPLVTARVDLMGVESQFTGTAAHEFLNERFPWQRDDRLFGEQRYGSLRDWWTAEGTRRMRQAEMS